MVASDFKLKILPVSNKLHRFAMRFLNDEDEAKDAIQDVFLKLWQKKEKLENVQNIEAFAMQMTRNRCLDILRDRKNKPAASATMQIVKTDATDVHLQVELSDSAKLIKRLVNELPDLQRKIMQMKDIDQLEYEEIAEITNMEMNAIRVNLSRARKKVRDEFVKLNDNGNFENKRFTAKIL